MTDSLLFEDKINDDKKLSIIKDLGEMIKEKRIKEQDDTNFKEFVSNLLSYIVEECNESWCDNCEIRRATGMLCNEYLVLN